MPFLCVVCANEPQATYNVQHKARAKKEDAEKIINDHFFQRLPRALLDASGYCSHLLRGLSFIVIYL